MFGFSLSKFLILGVLGLSVLNLQDACGLGFRLHGGGTFGVPRGVRFSTFCRAEHEPPSLGGFPYLHWVYTLNLMDLQVA